MHSKIHSLNFYITFVMERVGGCEGDGDGRQEGEKRRMNKKKIWGYGEKKSVHERKGERSEKERELEWEKSTWERKARGRRNGERGI